MRSINYYVASLLGALTISSSLLAMEDLTSNSQASSSSASPSHTHVPPQMQPFLHLDLDKPGKQAWAMKEAAKKMGLDYQSFVDSLKIYKLEMQHDSGTSEKHVSDAPTEDDDLARAIRLSMEEKEKPVLTSESDPGLEEALRQIREMELKEEQALEEAMYRSIHGDGQDYRRGTLQDVQNQLTEIARRYQDVWNDTGINELDGQFARLTLTQLESPEFKDWVQGQSDLMNVRYREALGQSRMPVVIRAYEEYLSQKPGFKNVVYYTLDNIEQHKGVLQRVNSSGHNNDCLLFSIIKDDKALLTRILGDEQQAIAILAKKENVDGTVRDPRNFREVRRKFFDDILANLDTVYPFEWAKVTSDGQIVTGDTFKPLLYSMITTYNRDAELAAKILSEKTGRRVEPRRITTIGEYLDTIYKNNGMLEREFATIFSLLYGVQAHVYIPLVGTKDQLMLATPTEFKLGKKGIAVYHSGMNGVHYQKLYRVIR